MPCDHELALIMKCNLSTIEIKYLWYTAGITPFYPLSKYQPFDGILSDLKLMLAISLQWCLVSWSPNKRLLSIITTLLIVYLNQRSLYISDMPLWKDWMMYCRRNSYSFSISSTLAGDCVVCILKTHIQCKKIDWCSCSLTFSSSTT